MIKNKDIHVGDEITISRTVTETKTVKVREIGNYLIWTDEFGHIANAAESNVYGKTGYPEYQVISVKHAQPKVENLPVQEGDVWLDINGQEWYAFLPWGEKHCLRVLSTPHTAAEGSNMLASSFEAKRLPAKLLHRRGNR